MMAEEATNPILDPTWMAVKKGDKAVAGEYLRKLASELLVGKELDRTDRIRLAWALMQFKGDPVAFFGYSRRGPSSTKTFDELVIWIEVTMQKDKLRKDGKSQVGAYADVAKKLGYQERKVKHDYEEVQQYIKQHEEERVLLSTGIASGLK